MKRDGQEGSLAPQGERSADFPPVTVDGHLFQLLADGAIGIAAVESLINSAERSICFEMYIYKADATGTRIRSALHAAARRGVRVRILLDDFGSVELPRDFFAELVTQSVELRYFNPSRVLRVAFRNHRKLVIADDRTAIVGGFNIGDEYVGDGVSGGWRDLGMEVTGPVVHQLVASFARMFLAARMDYASLSLFSRRSRLEPPVIDAPAVLTSGPGFGGAWLRRILYRDLPGSRSIEIITAYFAPTWNLRRHLLKAAKTGNVELILPEKTDVRILRLAGQHLYSTLLRDRVRIYEYRPQVLHAKLLIIDDVLYIGSCNLDVRSLRLNFELLVRVPSAELAAQARRLFTHDVALSDKVDAARWNRVNNAWQRLKCRFAYWLVVRLDPFLARRRLRIVR